ncbi:MAG: serine/threonine-protein kinase, partial [Planctomycetota bacterium]
KCGVSPFHQLNSIAQQRSFAHLLNPGRILGHYQIIRLVSKSSTALYQAKCQQSGIDVALKVLVFEPETTNQEQLGRFLREAAAIQNLSHPHLVPILEVGQDQNYYFFAMKWLDGLPFSKYIELNPANPNSLKLFLQILEAVEFVHQQGILHRDLKPGNIFVSEEGTHAYLIDFGLARISSKSSAFTTEGVSLGTPHFMSPEQAQGVMADVDQQSDIYSLGAILYQILTGVPPFLGDSPLEVFVKVLQEIPKTPRRRNSRIPVNLEKICLKAMSRQKSHRYRSVKEFRETLEHYLSQLKAPEYALRQTPISWSSLLIFTLFLIFFVLLLLWENPLSIF